MFPEPTVAATLLIVDDQPDDLGMIVGILENRGYRVIVVSGGAKGLACAAQVLPNLILLDVRTPTFDGLELCRQLKAQPTTANIPVIFMIALTQLEHKAAGFRAGGVDYVTKPVQIDEVLARVVPHLQIQILQRQLDAKNEELEQKVATRTAELTTANQMLNLKSYALNQVGEAAYLLDQDASFLYVNDEACRALGYYREELIGMTVMDIDPDWTPERWAATWRKMFTTKKFNVETRHRRKDGSIFPVEIHSSQFDYLGRNYNLALARDITERKQAEDQLRAREREFRTLAENVPYHIIRYDTQGRKTYINASTTRLLGVHANDPLGLLPADIPRTMCTGGSCEALAIRLQHTLQSGEAQEFEMNLQHAVEGGQTHSVKLTAERNETGEIVGALLIGQDITQTKRTEQELKLLNIAMDQSFDATYLVGADLRLRYINEAATRTLGYSREELLSMKLFDIDPSVSKEVIGALMQQTAEMGRFPGTVESTHRRKDGTMLPIEVGATTFTYDGEVLFLTVVRDITERKEIEHKLEESRDLLRQLSARRDAVREEERKHIAREIHDELGQMLTAQRLDIATLKFQFGAGNPILAQRCQRLLKIADQTLLTVRSIATSLRPAALDMGIVPALEWLVAEFRQRTGIDCQIQVGTNDLALDEVQAVGLFRIVQESLTNVTRHAEARQVTIVLDSDMDAYQLHICDDGKGFITKDRHTQSFGLMGIYERTLMLGGTAEVESTPGHGTAVNIRIPHYRQKDPQP